MLDTILRGNFLKNRNAYIVSGEPAIFHCHHYNCYLQAVLLDASSYINGIPELLINAAHELSYDQFTLFFKANPTLKFEQKKYVVEDYFRFCGFGSISLNKVNDDGGIVETKSEHYGIGWKAKFGMSKTPVSFFTRGFLAGATEAIYGLKPGSLDCMQDRCIAKGDPSSRFILIKRFTPFTYKSSQRDGQVQVGGLMQITSTNVNYNAIRNALIDMPLEGNAAHGLMDAFGVLLTRHYANYYCNVSYGILDLFGKQVGKDEIPVAAELLIEAGHVCAFNTFGGIMQSNEWNAMIKPMIEKKEDWVHGITAVVNSLGWGFWEIQDLSDTRLVMKIVSGYESNSYLRRYMETPSVPISFLATGGVAGLMNLIYVLNLPEISPVTLDERTYHLISSSKKIFKAKQLKCRAKGDEFDLIEAKLLSTVV